MSAGKRRVKLSPIVGRPILARVRPIDSRTFVTRSFTPDTVYEVGVSGYDDLMKLKTELPYGSPIVDKAVKAGLSYSKVGARRCGPCARRRGLKPVQLQKYVFSTFLDA